MRYDELSPICLYCHRTITGKVWGNWMHFKCMIRSWLDDDFRDAEKERRRVFYEEQGM